MEEQIEWITSKQVNEYINKQLEKLLLCEGFKKGIQKEGLLRLKEHHIQMICPFGLEEIKLKLIIAPIWIYRDSYHHSKNLRLKWSNKPNLLSNVYTDIAFKQKISSKIFYKKEEFFNVWDTVILPQVQKEIIDMYAKMDFDTYAFMCENGSDQDWKVGYEDAVCRNLVIGYNRLWNKQYEKGKSYLENAIAEMEKMPVGLSAKGEYAQDMENAKVILEVYEKRETGWEEMISNKLMLMEDTTLRQYLL